MAFLNDRVGSSVVLRCENSRNGSKKGLSPELWRPLQICLTLTGVLQMTLETFKKPVQARQPSFIIQNERLFTRAVPRGIVWSS